MKKEDIVINTEYIKLDQLLKFCGIAENGAYAKDIILNDDVYVNGCIEKQRGKKIKPGDTVTYGDYELNVCK